MSLITLPYQGGFVNGNKFLMVSLLPTNVLIEGKNKASRSSLKGGSQGSIQPSNLLFLSYMLETFGFGEKWISSRFLQKTSSPMAR